MEKTKNIQRKGVVKFDPFTAKWTPFTTSRERKTGWIAERREEDENLFITVKAVESLNYYDLIILLQMLDDYSKNGDKWIYQATIKIDDTTERILKKRTFDLRELCKQREISTHKNNRKKIAQSFERWYQAELTYQRDGYAPIKTRYIFESKIDENLNKITIIANINFLNFCLSRGMSTNWGRLAKYKEHYYAIGLDLYLQFRAIAYGKRNKKYTYPNTIKEETLFKHTGVEDDIKNIRHKRAKIKQAFLKFRNVTGVEYIYNKKERKWIKASYLKALKNKEKGV